MSQSGNSHLKATYQNYPLEAVEMLKKRIYTIITAVALMIAVTGASGVVADQLGFEMTPAAHACSGGSGGGSC